MPMPASSWPSSRTGYRYKIKLGLPGRDEEIAVIQEFIRNMGRLGIPVWCYEFMPYVHVVRTSSTIPSRGGALVTGYDHALMKNAPLTGYGEISDEQVWDNLKYFLEAVVPVAEEVNREAGSAPRRPASRPFGASRGCCAASRTYQKLLDLVPSPVNGIALCQNGFHTDDRRSAGGHPALRQPEEDLLRPLPRRAWHGGSFAETFHDDGKTDMLACLRATATSGMRASAAPTTCPMAGDDAIRATPASGGSSRLATSRDCVRRSIGSDDETGDWWEGSGRVRAPDRNP